MILPVFQAHAVSTERTILSPFTKEYRVLAASSSIRLFLDFLFGRSPIIQNLKAVLLSVIMSAQLDEMHRCSLLRLLTPSSFFLGALCVKQNSLIYDQDCELQTCLRCFRFEL